MSTETSPTPSERVRTPLRGGWVAVGSMIALGSFALAAWTNPKVSSAVITPIKPVKPAPAPYSTDTYSLRYATEDYFQRGGRYVLGSNDCSTYVTKFIKGSGAPLGRRLTTRQLIRPSVMRKLGFTALRFTPKGASELDVLVYRYVDDKDGRTYGHCGILVYREGELSLLHNSSRNGGLVATPWDKFLKLMGEQRVVGKPILMRRNDRLKKA